MQYSVRHSTTYQYSDPVVICQNQAHLSLRNTPQQTVAQSVLLISPEPVIRRTWYDPFGNEVCYFSIEEPLHELDVTARSVVDVRVPELPDLDRTPAWDEVRRQLQQPLTDELRLISQFCFESPFITFLPEADEYAFASFEPGRPLLSAVMDLTQRIFSEFKYSPAATAISTPTREVLESRAGVCQDFAHLQITCLRSLGLAARYVSGYLLTDPPPGQPKLTGADASHAWLSVYCPGTGWVDFDPTNSCIPQTRHVTIAWGRDYSDVTPLKGVFFGGGQQSLNVAVDVIPLDAEPSQLPVEYSN